MAVSKEEIGANAAATIFSLAVIIAVYRGVDLGEAAFRGVVCAIGTMLFGQFLGGIWVKAAQEGDQQAQ